MSSSKQTFNEYLVDYGKIRSTLTETEEVSLFHNYKMLQASLTSESSIIGSSIARTHHPSSQPVITRFNIVYLLTNWKEIHYLDFSAHLFLVFICD